MVTFSDPTPCSYKHITAGYLTVRCVSVTLWFRLQMERRMVLYLGRSAVLAVLCCPLLAGRRNIW